MTNPPRKQPYLQRALLAELEQGPRTLRQLALATGRSVPNVCNAARRLIASGAVVATGGGRKTYHLGSGSRSARAGEVCTCGRAAVMVFTGGPFGATGWCGRGDGGAKDGPCPFCGGERHTTERCPQYRLRPAARVKS